MTKTSGLAARSQRTTDEIRRHPQPAKGCGERKPEFPETIKVRRSHILLIVVVLIVLPAAVFWPALNHEFLNYDDPQNVTENPQIKALTLENVRAIFFDSMNISGYYIPVTFLTFSLDHALFGLDPRAFHRTNLILHIANVLFVFVLLYSLTRRPSLAFFAAALFAVHPLQVETVAWVTERKGLLATFFLLGTLLFYLRYLENSSRSSYAGAIIIFLISLLSKPSGLMLPALLLLLDFFFGRRWNRRVLYEKVPFLALSIIFGTLSFWGEKATGVMGAMPAASFNNLLAACYAVIFYLGKFIFPINLSAFYPYPENISIVYVLLTVAFIGGIYYFRNHREIFYGLAFFTLAILPVIKLVHFGIFIAADRLIYFPSLGLFFLTAWLLHHLVVHWLKTPWLKIGVLCLAFVGITGALAGLTFDRVKVWHDSEILWKDVLQRYPGAPLAQTCLGIAYERKGLLDEAIANYEKAVALDPRFAFSHTCLGDAYLKKGIMDKAIEEHRQALALDPQNPGAYVNLGAVYGKKGLRDQAMAHFRKALDINPKYVLAYMNLATVYDEKGMFDEAISTYRKVLSLDARNVQARTHLGAILMKKGLLDEAIEEHRRALTLDPRNATAQVNLGVAYAEKGMLDQAITQFRKALALDPDSSLTRTNLGFAYMKKGMLDQAIEEHHRAIALDPNDALAQVDLGVAYGEKGVLDQAIAQFQKALKLDPSCGQARFNLGGAYMRKGMPDEAIEQYRQALALDPNNATTQINLGAAYGQKGRLDEAIVQFQRALALDPTHAGAHYNLGLTYQSKKETLLAVQHFQKAKSLGYPISPEVITLLEKQKKK